MNAITARVMTIATAASNARAPCSPRNVARYPDKTVETTIRVRKRRDGVRVVDYIEYRATKGSDA